MEVVSLAIPGSGLW